MSLCDKCGYDHELEKFKESINAFKFIYAVLLVIIILNTLNTWTSGNSEIIKKLDAIDQKVQILMPAEVKP